MGLLDNLSSALQGALGQSDASSVQALIAKALGNTDLGSLNGIVAKLQQGGLATQVQSWLGDGHNLPVNADQLRAALGSDHVRQMAAQLGLPIDGALKLLSDHLPGLVDQASPSGKLPAAA